MTATIDINRVSNVVMGSVKAWDYPDFADAFIQTADLDGRPMTDEELELLNENSDFVWQCAFESLQ